MKNASFFPIRIRGKDYLIIQKGNIIEVEAEVVIMYLMDEGFVK